MKSHTAIHYLSLLTLFILSAPGYSQNKDNGLFDISTVKISEIGTNSIHSDFGPAIVQDSLYFTTFNDKLVEKTNSRLKSKEFYDLYKAVVDKQGNTISDRIPLKEFITRFNDGPVSWCPKTGELFVTQNYNDQKTNLKPFQEVVNRLRITIFKRVNGGCKNDSNFPYNNPAYSVGHPAITESGDTLLFSSDKPGGFGETDLYYSIRKNGKWETPVNLGPKINTTEKEEFGFITDHNFGGSYLIFASKGRQGKGGFDLYYTRFPSDYSQIGHFEDPINTEYDDFAMTIPNNAEYGYLTSNRPGKGDDDIYKFTFKRIVVPVIPQPRFRNLYVYDKSSLHPIPGANILMCDKKSFQTDVAGKVAALPCAISDCEVKASAFGYAEKTKVLLACTSEINNDTIWMNIIVNQKIALRNIYYDFDKWDILPDAALELDKLIALMKENPAMKVELGSHTDDRGTEVYNMRLSQLRAKSAVDYIVSKGVDQSRIKGTGYGKTQLIHKGTGGVKCTPEQNRENRRTEIFIPGFLQGEAVKQQAGDYSTGKPNASKEYSSKKEHGSIFEPTPEVIKRAEGETAKKGVAEPKVEKAPKVMKQPKPEPAPKEVDNAKVEPVSPVKPQTVTGIETVRYYLILGSFKDKTGAAKHVSKLKAEGYETTIISESEPFRVGMGYAKFSQAKDQLELLKDKYIGAWILKK